MIDSAEAGDKQFRALAMNSAQVPGSSEKTYLLAHQNVCLTTIDFVNRKIIGYTELLFVPLKLAKISKVRLNAKQCQIIKLLAKGSTDYYNCTFTYNDPLQEVVSSVEPLPPAQDGVEQLDQQQQQQQIPTGPKKNLKKFSSRHHDAVASTELDLDGGEIIVQLPPEVLKEISDGSTFKLLVEYSIEKPQGGLHFVVPEEDQDLPEAPDLANQSSNQETSNASANTGGTATAATTNATNTTTIATPAETSKDSENQNSDDAESGQNQKKLDDGIPSTQQQQESQEKTSTDASAQNGVSPTNSHDSDGDAQMETQETPPAEDKKPEEPPKKKSKHAHLFTYKNHNSSRLWFPCLDSYGQPCSWLLEFNVESHLTVVSCGDSIGVCTTPDKRFKTYRFELNTPTAAPNIGFACGPFDTWTSPASTNFTCPVKNYYITGLEKLVEASCSFVPECADFYEDYLTFKYPYSNYKQVFVDQAYEPCQSYATLSICCLNLLHSKHIIDQTFETRSVLSDALAAQFFSCFISMSSWSAAWLTRGVSLYVSAQYKRQIFGNNDYRYRVQETMQKLIQYEQKYGGIVLDESSGIANKCRSNFHFSTQCPHTLSPSYDEAHRWKSLLVIRMLEDRIGKTLLVQVFNKILSLAANASIQPASMCMWTNMLLSTVNFERAVFTVTGKDKEIASFLEHWIYQGGHAKFNGSFTFDRKRNVVELHIRQPDTGSTGIRPYFGSITVTVQELDGTFLQKLNIEENKTSPFVITCHSKSRRNKKKKIPLCTGEEVDMDLSMMDSHDSPVLWIRIDPDMQVLRQVVFEQPDFNWQYQLKYERDITAQLDSLQVLVDYPTVATRKTMMDIIEDERCFYRVRCKAALNLTKIANDMAITTTSGGWQAPTVMINIFKRLFGSHSCPHIIRLNNFSPTNLQSYFLQKTIPKALAGLRVPPHRICPPEVLKFLLDLFKYNDNSKNSFSDNYYRASLIEALAETVTPVVVPLFNNSMQSTTQDQIPSETKLVAEEITRCLNMEKVLPCYKYVVTVACLKAIQQLQRMGHLPSNSALFRSYTSENLFFDVRCAAVVQLVEIIRAEQSHSDLDFLLGLVEKDQVPAFKFFILAQLHKNPPMSLQTYPNYDQVKERLWNMMNSDFAYDSKLRCAAADVFHKFFGRSGMSSGLSGELDHKSKKKKKKRDKDKDRDKKKDKDREKKKDKDKDKKKSKKTKEGLSIFLGKMSR